MPDAQGNFLGDRATVLPDNTNALLHFSNLFAQKESQRRAQKAAQAKAEMDRRMAVQKRVGDLLTNKEFQTGTDFDKIIFSGLGNLGNKANDMFNEGASAEQVQMFVNQGLPGILSTAGRAKQIKAEQAAQLAEFQRQHPDADAAAIGSIAATKAYYTKDKDGNPVLKDINMVDPKHPWIQEAYEENPDLAFREDAITAAWDKIRQAKPKDANQIATYDKDQNLTDIPFNAKIHPSAAIVKGPDGKVLFDKDTGLPQVDILGSHNYQIDGQDYRDDHGQKVKVVDDNTFSNLYHGAIKAGIEKDVKKILSNGDLSPNSEYADMLRKSLLYDKLKDVATKSSSFTTLEGKSFERKNAIIGRDLQRAQLQLSRHSSALADQKFNWEKAKASIGGENGVQPLTDKYEAKAAKKIIDPQSGQPIRFIETKDIDKGDLQIITGNTPSTAADEASSDNTRPITLGAKKVYLLDDNGNWLGEDKDGKLKPIDRDAAYRRQFNQGDKGNAAIVAPPKKTVIQKTIDRVRKAVTPTKPKVKKDPLGIL